MAIRWPNLNRPLSKHHEFCTAVVMRVYDIWKKNGFDDSKGLPIMNYPGEENKWINNFASGSGEMHDEEGNYYYVSHPLLAYYVPFIWLNALGFKITVLNIQLWHCIIHFSSAMLFFLLIKAYTGNLKVALWSAVFYLLNGVSLWFQSNTYMSDMLVQVYFVSSLLAYTKLRQKYTLPKLIWLFISIGQMVYCSWFGYFTAVAILIHAIYKKDYAKRVSFTILLSLSFFTSLFIYQYSQVNGISALFAEWMQRGGERSGMGFANFFAILKNYAIHFSPILLLLLFFARKIEWKKYQTVLFLLCLPTLLMHIILSNYSVHDFTVLHALFPFSFVLTLALFKMKNVKLRYALSISMIVVFVGQYYFLNLPGETNYKGDRYDFYQEKGKAIASEREKGVVLFLWQDKIEPQTSFYAQCNVKSVNSQQEAEEFLKKRQGLQGKILYFDGAQLIRSQKINL